MEASSRDRGRDLDTEKTIWDVILAEESDLLAHQLVHCLDELSIHAEY